MGQSSLWNWTWSLMYLRRTLYFNFKGRVMESQENMYPHIDRILFDIESMAHKNEKFNLSFDLFPKT